MTSSNDHMNDPTGRLILQPNGRPRPMAPHVQVWRWHVTMTASILFRITIGAASVAAAMIVGLIAALASGPDAYAAVMGAMASPLGLFVGFGLSVVLFSFLLNGARHLINDLGQGLTVPTANLLANISVWGPIPLAVLFFIGLFATGRVSL